MNHWSLLTVLVVTAGMLESTRADETAVAFDDSTLYVGAGGTATYGWQFSTLSNIQISALGLYDFFKGDGLVSQHTIGIWDISNPSQPLVAATVPAGSLTPIMHDFRYVNIGAVTLPAGHDYAIAALYLSDDDTVGALNAPNWQLTVGPGLQFGGYRSGGVFSSVLTFPDHYSAGVEEAFGPNFIYTVVPEPDVLSLLSLCTLILCWLIRRSPDNHQPIGMDCGARGAHGMSD